MYKNITEIIRARRATPPRMLTGKEISKEIVEELLENASWAPNHKKTEPWRFKVYTGEAKEKLAETCRAILEAKKVEGFQIADEKIDKFIGNLLKPPVAIAIVLQTDPAQRLPEWEELAAVSMAVQNMWLTATEKGLGAFWATPDFVSLFDEVIGIENGQKMLGFFFVGNIVMELPSPGRGDVNALTEWK